MLDRATRRARGAFETPAWLVDEIVDETLAGPLARAPWDDGAPRLRILDPAAGDGRFLTACVERLVALGARREVVLRRCVVGVERDPASARAARAALPGADIRIAEALLSGAVEPGAWDVVVGNPPYLRSVALLASDPDLWRRLRGALAATSWREWDLYGAFLEKSLEWVAPGGEIGLVVPSRWLTAAFAAPLRERLAPAVKKIVDLGARQVFEGATTYVALVHLAPSASGPVTVVREGRAGRVARETLGAAPWALAVGEEAAALEALRRAGPPLASIARIAKGAGTNADPVFLLEPRGARYRSAALDEEVDLEPDLIVPCLRGRDIRPYAASAARAALLPYDGARLLAPDELPPRTRRYLERCRPLLEARERGRFTGARFHAWGRPQNLIWLRDRSPKVVVPDAAAEGRAFLDDRGWLAIDTAYAIRPIGDVPIGRILEALNSSLPATWLRALGIPLRGGYFRMKTAYLASLPVP
jgi:hypothetical protein